MCHTYIMIKTLIGYIKSFFSTYLNALGTGVYQFLGIFPTRLPVGMTEFNIWAQSVIKTYGLPNNDSVVFSLAVMVLHLDSTTDRKPKLYFAKSVRKAMSNQIVSQVIQDLKAKQQAADKAAQEATKKDNVVAIGEPAQNA